MSTNITGVIVTSSSCSGTCLTFSIPRQPKVSAAESGARPRRPRRRGERLAQRLLLGGALGVGSLSPVCSSLLLAADADRLFLSSSAGRPVSARNTSSRLGWPSEKSAISIPERASSATASAAAVGVGAGDRERRRVGLQVDLGAELAGEHPLGLGPLSGSSRRTCSAPDADRRLELGGRALGDHLAVVDHRDPVGELVGLVEVLGAEQDRRPLGDQRRG